MLTVTAAAKINLTLEVLARRPDGYHDIRTLLQAVSLCDVVKLGVAAGTSYRCDLPGWQAGFSLVARAVEVLKLATGYPGGADIDIHKNIPLQSGLGGDASDAAAVLRGLNTLWDLKLSHARLGDLAARLGSDVPFFLTGGTALARGRGDEVAALPDIKKYWLVLMVPAVKIPAAKTASLYALLSPACFTRGEITGAAVDTLLHHRVLASGQLFNVFERVAAEAFPGLAGFREAFLEAGAGAVHLAGAGPALFSLHREKARAETVQGNLKSRGLAACLAETLRAGEVCAC